MVKRQKKSDKEFSIIPYHSACPCEYPCVATSAFGEPRLRSLCVQASFHTLAGTSFRTEKSRSRKYCSAVNHLKASSGTSHIGCCCQEEAGNKYKKPLQRRLQGFVRDRVGEIYSSGFILSQNSVSVKLLLVFVYTIFIIIFSSSMNS